jgi:hypothetical protein
MKGTRRSALQVESDTDNELDEVEDLTSEDEEDEE